jgi:hypothetical protein
MANRKRSVPARKTVGDNKAQNTRTTVSEPTEPPPMPDNRDDLAAKFAGTAELAERVPFKV